MADLSRTGSIIPQWPEVRGYLEALWLLSKGDARGLQAFDISDRGVARSFWAVIWSLPASLALYIFGRPELTSSFVTLIPLVTKSLLAIFADCGATVATLALMAVLLDLRPVLRTLIIAFNWLTLPVLSGALLFIPIGFLDRPPFDESPLFGYLMIAMGIVIILPMIVIPWRIVCTITGGDWLIRSLLFTAVILIPLAITMPLEQYLGISSW